MLKRILVVGALLTILVATGVSVLSILDIITSRELWTTLGKTISVIAVITAAAMLAGLLVRIVKKA